MGSRGVSSLVSQGFSAVVALIVVWRLVSRFVVSRLVVPPRTVASFSSLYAFLFYDHGEDQDDASVSF
jgi:hypothetical protein